MKSIVVLLLLMTSEIYANPQNEIRDSAGVYLTKEDFLNNRVSYGSHILPSISWIFGIKVIIDIYSNFTVYGKIRFELEDSSWKTFNPGDISGFYVNGHKYLYFQGGQDISDCGKR